VKIAAAETAYQTARGRRAGVAACASSRAVEDGIVV
jgi:hypothetical protein